MTGHLKIGESPFIEGSVYTDLKPCTLPLGYETKKRAQNAIDYRSNTTSAPGLNDAEKPYRHLSPNGNFIYGISRFKRIFLDADKRRSARAFQ